jgi:hypothetical protein
MRTPSQIFNKVEALRKAHSDRDQRQKDVRDIRAGDIEQVVPGSMPDAWPKPIVANAIDTTARDISEVMGAMPAINCTNSIMTSARAKKFSSKRTKIAQHYVLVSRLEAGKQIEFCDYYNTYGMAVYSVEPDFDRMTPIIRVENPISAYPEYNIFGVLQSYTRVWREKAIQLATKYPELVAALKPPSSIYGQEDNRWMDTMVEVAKYQDADQIYMFLPEHANRVVKTMPNPMKKLMVSVACRPSHDGQIRGMFDDAKWVYLARSRMALLGLEATEKSVRAPLFVPRDVTVMEFGDDAVVRSDSPEKARYLVPDMPQFANQESQLLGMELNNATRSPAARQGNLQSSIITGKGVEALMGSFNTVISTGQQVVGYALEGALRLAFEMDEKLWPSEKKTIRGVVQGTPFEEVYTPSKDIDGNYSVDVTYGFASGQDPARAIVALLQLRGDKLVSRDFVQRQLPMQIDVVQMQQQVDSEDFEDALKAGTQMLMQGIGNLTMQGQDPSELLTKLAKVIQLREGGKPVHESILEAFKPKEAPQQPGMAPPGMPGQGPGGGFPGGPSGAPQGGPAPMAGQPGGGDMMQLLASLKGGGQAPAMTARTKRSIPI